MTATERRKARDQQARDAHKARYNLVARHTGYDLRTAVKVQWKTASFTTWDEAVAELAAGITVTHYCQGEQNSGPRQWSTHRLRFNADGTIEMLNHPGREVVPDAELMLAGLGAEMCACLAAAIYLPSRLLMTSGPAMNTINGNLRMLYAAVQWAQQPDAPWSPEFGDEVLRYGITPALLAEWVEGGWERVDAIRFLQAFATRFVADQWRAAGQLSKRAARLAARGESPSNEDRWAAAGFTPSQSAKWRKFPYSPEVAFEWNRHKVSPTMVEALEKASRWQPNPIPVEMSKAWTKAGIPAGEVLAWIPVTDGDLDEALRWRSPKLQSWVYKDFQDFNRSNPHRAITPEHAKAYLKVGFTRYDLDLMADAIERGITPQMYLDVVAAVASGAPEVAGLVARLDEVTEKSDQWREKFSDADHGVYLLQRGSGLLVAATVKWMIANSR